MNKIFTWFKIFYLRLRGFEEVVIPVIHCGCCGKWVDEPEKLWLYKGRVTWFDGWGLCGNCCGHNNFVNRHRKK
jgi:hypothetical protein